MTPTYDLGAFIEACAQGSKVTVHYDARTGARVEFGLPTEKALLEFIGNDGLEDPEFECTRIWGNNQNPSTEIMVDSYRFRSGKKCGYIAFLFMPSPGSGRWRIKSFKRDANPARSFQGLASLEKILEDARAKKCLPVPEQPEKGK